MFIRAGGLTLAAILITVAAGYAGAEDNALLPVLPPTSQAILLPEEGAHLRNVRQLSFGHSEGFEDLSYPANYAEAYWSPDGRKLILQATRDRHECDQQFVLDIVTGSLELVSTGAGRVTCGYFAADGEHFVYSSTHETLGHSCPPRPDMSQGYVWPVYDYDIYYGHLGDAAPPVNLTATPGYDAEGTMDWARGLLYFTSTRDGDVDVYRMDMADRSVLRLTDEFGYDGGPFVSYDGQTVVYRRQVFKDDAERQDYSGLLAQNLVRPTHMELMAMNGDGSGKRQLTSNGRANFAPFLHPDNDTVVFCSNLDDPKGRDFDLYTISLSQADGVNFPAPQRITWAPEFDGFPMFSPDGRYLVWCSNRNHERAGETNVFVAEWIP